MANEWREHVKKTMNEMRASAPKGKTVMLKDVLQSAKKTYKKSTGHPAAKTHKKSHKNGKKGKKGKTVRRRKSNKKGKR
jgi:hypothetical protein